jgi:hypothetical protein
MNNPFLQGFRTGCIETVRLFVMIITAIPKAIKTWVNAPWYPPERRERRGKPIPFKKVDRKRQGRSRCH